MTSAFSSSPGSLSRLVLAFAGGTFAAGMLAAPTLAAQQRTLPLRQSTLDARTRELLIMRIGALCRSDYEWAAHAPAGRRAGMTDADVQHILEGPRAGSDEPDDTLLKAVDELYTDRVISDGTWQRLASRFNEQQLLDILITAGGYHMVSMALNSFGVQLEPGGEGLPPAR